MMFSDPLALAIIAMVIGMLLGAICCVLAFMIYLDVHDKGFFFYSDDDLSYMHHWYEAEYGRKDNDHDHCN